MTRRVWIAALTVAAAAACDAPGGGERSASASTEVSAPIAAGAAGLDAYLDCLSAERVTLVGAHRGGPAPGYPENALATFAHTLSRAPALIEIDIATTRDGVLALMHDDTLDRTTTCTGRVDDRTWAELSECRLVDDDGHATDFAIPTLSDALAWADGATVLELDIKSTVRYEDVIDAVRTAGAEERVILISYSLDGAARLARLAPEMTISASVAEADDLDALAARGVAPDRIVAWTGTERPDPALYAALDAREVPVLFGTLGGGDSIDADIARTGEESRYRVIAAGGADVVVSDRPVAAYEAIRAARDPALALDACRTAGDGA